MCIFILSLLIFTGPLKADVYLQPTSITQQLIQEVEQGNSQNIQLLIEQGADVNVRVGSSPLFIRAIEDLGEKLQALEENSTKLWIGRCLIGLGALGLVWAGYSYFSSRSAQLAIKRDHPDPLSTDDLSPASPGSPPLASRAAASPSVDAQPSAAKFAQPEIRGPSNLASPESESRQVASRNSNEAVSPEVHGRGAHPHSGAGARAPAKNAAPPRQEPVSAKSPQAQLADDDSDDDSPPPPVSHVQQSPPPLARSADISDQRGNVLPPKPTGKSAQPMSPTVGTTTSDDVPTSGEPKKKPGLWKRFKNWFSPTKGMANSSHKQADITPLYATAVIAGIAIARSGGKVKASSTQIADRLAVIMALLDIPELDLAEKNEAQETVLEVIDRCLAGIKNKQSQETLLAIRNSIRREVDSGLQ